MFITSDKKHSSRLTYIGFRTIQAWNLINYILNFEFFQWVFSSRSGDAISVSAKNGESYAQILKAIKAKVNPQNATPPLPVTSPDEKGGGGTQTAT